jgi:hypothetical protein
LLGTLIVHLVPPEAVINDFLVGRTFAEMKQEMSKSNINSATKHSTFLGASNVLIFDESTNNKQQYGNYRQLQMIDDPSTCNNSTSFYCWMSCLSIPDHTSAARYLEEGLSLYCVDPTLLNPNATNRKELLATAIDVCSDIKGTNVVAGGAMDTSCMGAWHPTEVGLSSTTVQVVSNGTSPVSVSVPTPTAPIDVPVSTPVSKPVVASTSAASTSLLLSLIYPIVYVMVLVSHLVL